jgi:hypothetical protein
MKKEVSIWIKLYALYDFKNDQITLLYRYSNVLSLTMVFIHHYSRQKHITNV